MININDLMEMKNEAEKYDNEAHSIVCHPDNYKLILKCVKSTNGKSLLGLQIFTSSLAPKDKIYVLSKDAVDQIREALGKTLRGSLLND